MLIGCYFRSWIIITPNTTFFVEKFIKQLLLMKAKNIRLSAIELAQKRYDIEEERHAKSFISLESLTSNELKFLINSGLDIKKNPASYTSALVGCSVALLFQKTSTRTRASFEAGVRRMGGNVDYIDWARSNLVLAELCDEVPVFSRFYDYIVARVDKHETLEVMARESKVPVISGLCDRHHPCQAVSDVLTMSEYFGNDLHGLRLSYIGDGNNVCRSLVHAAQLLGIEITLCSPTGFTLDLATVAAAGKFVREVEDPREAAKDAHVIYTDTWISMGQEDEMARRVQAFKGYEVNDEIMNLSDKDSIFMHCLPAHPGQEVSASVLRSPRSIVLDQAENRMYGQNALLLWLRQK
jgi:ornithine carbamoyltransferase